MAHFGGFLHFAMEVETGAAPSPGDQQSSLSITRRGLTRLCNRVSSPSDHAKLY